VFEGTSYDQSCDIWSIGVIAFFMLSGKPPFMGNDDLRIQQNITTCNFSFSDKEWNDVSPEAKDWIDKMLELDPKDRMTPDDALAHPWLETVLSGNIKKYHIHPSVMLNLHGCNEPSQLLYELLVLFTQFLNDDDIKAIRETF